MERFRDRNRRQDDGQLQLLAGRDLEVLGSGLVAELADEEGVCAFGDALDDEAAGLVGLCEQVEFLDEGLGVLDGRVGVVDDDAAPSAISSATTTELGSGAAFEDASPPEHPAIKRIGTMVQLTARMLLPRTQSAFGGRLGFPRRWLGQT
jgi:hypothetical protein